MGLVFVIGWLSVGLVPETHATESKANICAALLKGLDPYHSISHLKEQHTELAFRAFSQFWGWAQLPRPAEGGVSQIEAESESLTPRVAAKIGGQIRGLELQFKKPQDYPEHELTGVTLKGEHALQFIKEWEKAIHDLEDEDTGHSAYFAAQILSILGVFPAGILTLSGFNRVMAAYLAVAAADLLISLRHFDLHHDQRIAAAKQVLEGGKKGSWLYSSWKKEFLANLFEAHREFPTELGSHQTYFDLMPRWLIEPLLVIAQIYERQMENRKTHTVYVDMVAYHADEAPKLAIMVRMAPNKPQYPRKKKEKKKKKLEWKPAYQQI